MKKFRYLIVLLLLSLFIVGCSAVDKEPIDEEEEQQQEEVLNEGELAVSFEFLDYQGNTVTLEDLKGEKVYLKFFEIGRAHV